MKRKIKKFFKRICVNKVAFAIFLFILPLIIDLIYHVPIEFFFISESDLLQFYGVTFGIFASYVTYSYEKEKSRKSRDSELKPCMAVKLIPCEGDNFEISISNVNDVVITDLFLFDELIDNVLQSQKKYKVNFNPENKNSNILDFSNYDKDLVDTDGYPKYILISSCDAEDRMWQSEYLKHSNGKEKTYILKDIYLA